jgi:hypothetical protein
MIVAENKCLVAVGWVSSPLEDFDTNSNDNAKSTSSSLIRMIHSFVEGDASKLFREEQKQQEVGFDSLLT